MNRPLTVSFTLLLLGGFVGVQAVAAADRYRFEPRVAAGDVYETTETLSVKLQVAEPAEAAQNSAPFTVEMETRIRREVLAAQKGQPTDLRLTYLVDRSTIGFGGEARETSYPNAGLTFRVRKRSNGVEVTSEQGKQEKGTLQGMAAQLSGLGPVRFPNVDFGPGEGWDVPANPPTAPDEPPAPRATAKFLEVSNSLGETIARIQIERSSRQPVPGLDTMEMVHSSKGELRYSTQRQRPLELTLAGPIRAEGVFPQEDGKEIRLVLVGEGKESYREKWIKVGGKPARQP